MPKVSAVIPAYNYGHFVGEAIQSVLDQTFRDLELLVVDDGSTDNTKAVVDTFNDDRLRYIYQENQGLSAARNAGIRASSGQYFAFLDADDTWLPQKLELQTYILDTNPKMGLVYTGAFLMDAKGQVVAIQSAKYKGEVFRPLLFGNIVCGSGSTPVVRRECFNQVGLFDEALNACEDRDMWLRIAKVYEFAYADKPLVKKRLHGANMSRDTLCMKKARFTVLDKVFSDPALPDEVRALKSLVYAKAHFGVGRDYCTYGQIKAARAEFVESIRAYPYWPIPYVFLASSFLGTGVNAEARYWKEKLRIALLRFQLATHGRK